MSTLPRWEIRHKDLHEITGKVTILQDNEAAGSGQRVHVLMTQMSHWDVQAHGFADDLCEIMRRYIPEDPRYTNRVIEPWAMKKPSPSQQDTNTGTPMFPCVIMVEEEFKMD